MPPSAPPPSPPLAGADPLDSEPAHAWVAAPDRTRTGTYRLASAEVAGTPVVVVDVDGRLCTLADLLRAAGDATTAPDELMDLLADWAAWDQRLATAAASAGSATSVDERQLRWLAPLRYPHKLICIGINYRDHIAEMKLPTLPEFPYSFLKPATTTLVGSGETVRLPARSTMVDWEAELAVVIGPVVEGPAGQDPMSRVAAYSILNDLSARDWIASSPPVGVDWVMQKAYDGFSPMGPYLTPASDVPDPQDLRIECKVNGVPKQVASTAQMFFPVRDVVAHLLSIMTLEPGDVIATGTPSGVGYGRRPMEFLASGDVVTVEIEGLGLLQTPLA